MNLITKVCTEALTDITAYTCGGLKGNRVHSLIIAKSNMEWTVAVSGTAPSLSEVQAQMLITGDDHLTILTHISNGLIDEVGSSELTDLDTESGLPEKFNIQMGITRNIKHPTEDVLIKTMEHNQQTLLKVWVIDNKGYIWGGKTGYLTNGSNAFSPKKLDGTVLFISFNLVYIADAISDDAGQDVGFLTLDNA
jgi:hypothetical protein